MSTTGQNLLVGFSRFINDYQVVETTGAGSTTTFVDTGLAGFANDYFIDWYARITESGHSALWQIRRVSDFVSSTGTGTVPNAFGASTGSSTAMELHKYDPEVKFQCLDEARISAYPALGQVIYNDTRTGDGEHRVFDIPSAIRRGPLVVLEEEPLPTNYAWNFLANPIGDSTTGWTASSSTHTTVDRVESDKEIPKYDFTCSKVAVATTTNGVLNQVVGDMSNGITAALAAGRHMTFAAWVYCRTASRVTLEIIDDSGSLGSSSAHGGAGWELLTVEADVGETNATTLTVQFDVSNAAGAVTFWWNRAWFYFGTPDRVQDIYSGAHALRHRRDDTTQKVKLDSIPIRGHQLRMIGRDYLSALGTTASTQVTNTMEVDEFSAQVLYAEAARILFGREQFSTVDFPDLAPRIAKADALKREMLKAARMSMPTGRGLRSMWAS